MPASLVNYKTVQIVSPDPTGVGGLAINNNFKTLVDTKSSRPNTRRVTHLSYGQIYDAYTATFKYGLLGFGDAPASVGATGLNSPDANEPATVSYLSGAVNNDVVAAYGAAIYRTGRNILFQTHAKISSTSAIRVFIGISREAYTTMAGSDNPANSRFAGFRYSTSAGDTTWKCVTKDSTTLNAVDSTVSASTAGRFFQIEFDDANSKALFSIDGVLRATVTSNLPGSGHNTRFVCTVTTLEAAAKLLRLAWVYLESDK